LTLPYQWNPMPHVLDVRCPKCGSRAKFEFAEIVRIEKKLDISFFLNSKLFDYAIFKDYCGHNWHGAIFYLGLHGGNVKTISDMPEGYEPENWSHSKYLFRSHGLDLGSIRCSTCYYESKHNLK
jgi:hypothetical protein